MAFIDGAWRKCIGAWGKCIDAWGTCIDAWGKCIDLAAHVAAARPTKAVDLAAPAAARPMWAAS